MTTDFGGAAEELDEIEGMGGAGWSGREDRDSIKMGLLADIFSRVCVWRSVCCSIGG